MDNTATTIRVAADDIELKQQLQHESFTLQCCCFVSIQRWFRFQPMKDGVATNSICTILRQDRVVEHICGAAYSFLEDCSVVLLQQRQKIKSIHDKLGQIDAFPQNSNSALHDGKLRQFIFVKEPTEWTLPNNQFGDCSFEMQVNTIKRKHHKNLPLDR
jgi:hypothetical protein